MARLRVDASRRPRVHWAIGATDTHAHHAVQIITATTALTVLDAAGTAHTGRQVIVPADTAHRIITGAAAGTVIFLDPETAAGAAAHHRAAHSGWSTGFALPGGPDEGATLGDAVTALLTALTPTTSTVAVGRHQAVTAALNLIPDLIAEGAVGTGELAARVGISPSRLTHLFTTEVGLPVRRYVLWQRLLAAVIAVAAGRDLTTAAHAAGFADSAHLTRTCRENFGLPPSALRRNISWHR